MKKKKSLYSDNIWLEINSWIFMKTGNSINIPEKNKDEDEDKKDKDTDKGTRGKKHARAH